MESMRDYLKEVETWIEEVEDPEKDVSDLDFLDKLVNKGAPRKGNDGLANVGAYLAITEEQGELQVNEELVEALDQKQKESEYGGDQRFSNIVYEGTTSKREGKTLYDKEVDGHETLRGYIEAFKQNGDLDSSLPNDNIFKDINQNQNSNNSKGGDNTMTDQEYNELEDTLAGTIENHDEYSTELVHAAARLEREGVDLMDELEDKVEEYRDEGMTTMQAVQGYLDHNMDQKLGEVEDLMDSLYQKVDSIDTSDRGNLNGAVVDQVESITGNTYN